MTTLTERIAQANVNFAAFKAKKAVVVPDERIEMALTSARRLDLSHQVNYYTMRQRRAKLEAYGYTEITLAEISQDLFGPGLRWSGFERDRGTFDGIAGSTKRFSVPTYTEADMRSDRIDFRAPGFFGRSRGFLASPKYLNQPIPPELLGRMHELANSNLIDCFMAAGYADAFTFEKPRIPRVVDPIILAVLTSHNVVSPLLDNTHMYFVGKYN